ncbi:Cell wall integrity and stress response component 3 precursor, partial [Reticulomyxa filosa]
DDASANKVNNSFRSNTSKKSNLSKKGNIPPPPNSALPPLPQQTSPTDTMSTTTYTNTNVNTNFTGNITTTTTTATNPPPTSPSFGAKQAASQKTDNPNTSVNPSPNLAQAKPIAIHGTSTRSIATTGSGQSYGTNASKNNNAFKDLEKQIVTQKLTPEAALMDGSNTRRPGLTVIAQKYEENISKGPIVEEQPELERAVSDAGTEQLGQSSRDVFQQVGTMDMSHFEKNGLLANPQTYQSTLPESYEEDFQRLGTYDLDKFDALNEDSNQ